MRKARLFIAALAALLSTVSVPADTADHPYAAQHAVLIEVVRRNLVDVHAHLGMGVPEPRVLAAMQAVPRHEFVPSSERHRSYEDRPLPIGYGQTISQPSIVALMTELLEVGTGERVLEIGTGSGYQAAVLAELGVAVYTIEIIEPLARRAGDTLRRLYPGVQTRRGNGYYGWEDAAPFDAIIVTAATNHIPPPLLAQLRPGGRLVIPLGNPLGAQHLVLARKDPDGRVTTRKLLAVRFVPLSGRPPGD